MVLVQIQRFEIFTRYGLEILNQCRKTLKTKIQKVLGLISTFREISGWGQTGRYGAVGGPILNWVKMELNLNKIFYCQWLQLTNAVSKPWKNIV